MRMALKEIKRVTKEGGRVLLAFVNPFFGQGWTKSVWKKDMEKVNFRRVDLIIFF